MVASKTKSAYDRSLNDTVLPEANGSNTSPANPTATPINCFGFAIARKNAIPASMVNKGVSEFSIAASELSMRVSAMQYRYAGKKLPKKPESTTCGKRLRSTFRKACQANGNNTTDALAIRKEATWYAESACMPTFISRNELPQMSESTKNRSHAVNLLCTEYFGKGYILIEYCKYFCAMPANAIFLIPANA